MLDRLDLNQAGDMDNNGSVDLEDLILVLKVLSGEDTAVNKFAALNGNVLSISDAVYILSLVTD
jgi:hypothetical protein